MTVLTAPWAEAWIALNGILTSIERNVLISIDDEYYDEADDEADDMDVEKELHCVNCGSSVQLDWKYCLACGASLPEKHCVRCGERVANDWDYCPWCGSMIPDKIITTAQSSSCASSNWAVQTGNAVYDDSDIPF